MTFFINDNTSDVLIALLKEHLYTVLSSGIDDEDVRQSLPGLTKQLMSDFAIYMNCIEVDHAKYVTTLPAMNVYKMRMKQPAGKQLGKLLIEQPCQA